MFEKQVEAQLGTEFEKKLFAVNLLTSGLKSMIDAIEQRTNATKQAEQAKNKLAVSKMQLRKARIDTEAKSTGLTKKALRTPDNKVISTDGRAPTSMLAQ